MQILLDRVSNDQLIYNSLLRNASHPFTVELSNEATFGIDRAMLGSHLAPRYHAATITKFMDTKETVMPASVGSMVSGGEGRELVDGDLESRALFALFFGVGKGGGEWGVIFFLGICVSVCAFHEANVMQNNPGREYYISLGIYF